MGHVRSSQVKIGYVPRAVPSDWRPLVDCEELELRAKVREVSSSEQDPLKSQTLTLRSLRRKKMKNIEKMDKNIKNEKKTNK